MCVKMSAHSTLCLTSYLSLPGAVLPVMETLFRVVANSSAKDKHARVMRTVVDKGNGHRADGEKVGRKSQTADCRPSTTDMYARGGEKGGMNIRYLSWCTRSLDLYRSSLATAHLAPSGAGSCRRCPAVPIPTGSSLTDRRAGGSDSCQAVVLAPIVLLRQLPWHMLRCQPNRRPVFCRQIAGVNGLPGPSPRRFTALTCNAIAVCNTCGLSLTVHRSLGRSWAWRSCRIRRRHSWTR